MFSRNPLSSSYKSFRMLLLVLSAMMLVVGVCGAQTPRHKAKPGKVAKEQIQALEFQWRDATIAGDAVTMEKLLAEDFIGISWTGQVKTKAQQLDRIRNRTVAVREMTLNDIKIKVVGSVAIVTSRATVQGSSDAGEINGDFRYTRIYQRRPSGTWQITNFEATRVPSGDRPRRHEAQPTP